MWHFDLLIVLYAMVLTTELANYILELRLLKSDLNGNTVKSGTLMPHEVFHYPIMCKGL